MKRARELEEARKAGLAPAEVDQETGQEINPHIPNYMTQAPWYLQQDKISLKHQKDWRLTIEKEEGKEWYQRGLKGKANKKWKKGACENCGATTHATKDCLERPRKRAAKYSNADIAADDVIQDVQFKSFDHKRDRWNGFTAEDYAQVVARYDAQQALRQELLRSEEKEARYAEDATESAAAAAAAGEDRIADDEAAECARVEKRVRGAAGAATGSVRNLRIREDTAKYLLNLDEKSAHYDPKSRSMREDPLPDKAAHEKTFAGDNAVRGTGEYDYWRQLTQHTTLEAKRGARGVPAHMQAAPSQAELLHRDFKAKKAKLMSKNQTGLLDKYGSAAAPAPDADLLLPQSEAYVEYDRAGRVVKGVEHRVRSRYEEDVHPGNHTSVWGSFWHEGRWGYACCHSMLKNSMCMGGKAQEVEAANRQVMDANAQRFEEERAARREAAAGSAREKPPVPTAAVWGTEGEQEQELDQEKVREALRRLREESAGAGQESGEINGKAASKGYHGLAGDSTTVSAEDMEAYRLHRERTDDPLANMKRVGGTSGGYEMV